MQIAAIPEILPGNDALVSAPTASGKTEAVAAPLAERDLARPAAAPALLYVCPTRALVNDLYRRLKPPLERLGIELGRKTSDHPVAARDRLERWIVTTPESLDSLLVRRPRDLAGVRAVVADEVHLLDGTPRGDQLRVLLARLRRLHRAAVGRGDRDPGERLQTVLLSATVEDPPALVQAFARQARIIACPGVRAIETTGVALGGPGGVGRALQSIPRAQAAKLLVFTRSRAECEEVAAELAGRPPYGNHVYAHHGSLSRRARLAAEDAFHHSTAAVFVATSTLELGIDIGDVDWVVQFGPPPSVSSFLQQIGRGCRREKDVTRVLGIARSAAEQVIFEVLLDRARQGRLERRERVFAASVVVQQVGSYLLQRSSGTVGRPELEALLSEADPGGAGPAAAALLDSVLPAMVEAQLLVPARGGRFTAGPVLDRWFESDPRRLHTTMGQSRDLVSIYDAATHEHLGDVPRSGLPAAGPLALGGRAGRLTASGGGRAYLERVGGDATAPRWFTPRMPMSLDLAQAVRRHLGIPDGVVPAMRTGDRTVAILAFLGGTGSRVLAAHLRISGHTVRSSGDVAIELSADAAPHASCLRLDAGALGRSAATCFKQLERLMEAGAHAGLLPDALRRDQVIARLIAQGLLDAIAGIREVQLVDGEMAQVLAPFTRG